MGLKKFFHSVNSLVTFGKYKSKESVVSSSMRSEFLNSITFEENPFEGETPDKVTVYDLDGNEVDA